jgi:hypothetical protein
MAARSTRIDRVFFGSESFELGVARRCVSAEMSAVERANLSKSNQHLYYRF